MYTIADLKSFMYRFFAFTCSNATCICCGKKVYSAALCKRCADKHLFTFLPLTASGRCSLCGKNLLGSRGLCSDCAKSPVLQHVDRVFPLYPYRLWYKKLLFDWKMAGQRSLSPLFAKAIFLALQSTYTDDRQPVLVPVPPRPGKLKAKGWDQIEELTGLLEKKYKWPVLKALERLSVEEQKKKGRQGRLDSSSTSYRLLSCKIPKEVILLDDVMTTGATVEACAFLLKAAGAIKVQVITLLIVD